MNLLAIIIVFLAIATAGAIVYIAWELSSGDPAVSRATPPDTDESADSGDRPGSDPGRS